MAMASNEVWFFVSELEWVRSGTFRQERWVEAFFRWHPRVTIFNVMGAFHLAVARCENPEAFQAFRARSRAEAPVAASVREGALVPLIRRLKHTFFIDLYLPNVLLLFLRACLLLASAREPVVIMCSSPPFSMALAGCLLKRLFPRKVVLVVDMRDAWAFHPALGGNRQLKCLLERWVVRASDQRLTVSTHIARELEGAYGRTWRTVYNVATHYQGSFQDEPLDLGTLEPRIRAGTLKLVYTGSTPERFYDAEGLVEGTRRYLDRHPGDTARLQFLFVGACGEVQKAAARAGGLEDMFIFLPTVPHAKARAIQTAADALVFMGFVAPGNGGVITTKFFEYLALGRPIFPVTIHPGSDTDQLLQRFAGGSPHLLAPNEIAEALAGVHLFGTTSLPRCADPGALQELHRDYLALVADLLGPEKAC